MIITMAPNGSGLPVSTPLLQYDSDTPLIKWLSLFLHILDLGWPCDLLWSMEYDESDTTSSRA